MADDREEPTTRPRGEREFPSKIGFLLLDKVVFGLLIVLAGFVLNSILDHNRAKSAFQNEIAKVRVEKAAEVWGALDRQQLLAEELGPLFKRVGCTDSQLPELPQIRSELAQGNVQFQRMLATNRFWLGDELFAQLRAYERGQTDLVAILGLKLGLLHTVLVNVSNMQHEKLARAARQLGEPRSSPKGTTVAAPNEACDSGPAGDDGGVSRAVRDLTKKRQDVVEVMNEFVR